METQQSVGKKCRHGYGAHHDFGAQKQLAKGVYPVAQLSKDRMCYSLGPFFYVATGYLGLDKSGINIVHFSDM